MGMWGYKLYQNDTALDVKDLFQDLYRTGKSVQEITDQMTQDSKSMFGDPTEEAFFWFALADSQWEVWRSPAQCSKKGTGLDRPRA